MLHHPGPRAGRARRFDDHPAIAPFEQVQLVTFTLGPTWSAALTGPLPFAALGAGRRPPSAPSRSAPTPATGSLAAESARRSGLVVLTDRRLLFFAKRTALGRAGRLTAWAMRSEIISAEDALGTVTIGHTDGARTVLSLVSSSQARHLAASLCDASPD